MKQIRMIEVSKSYAELSHYIEAINKYDNLHGFEHIPIIFFCHPNGNWVIQPLRAEDFESLRHTIWHIEKEEV